MGAEPVARVHRARSSPLTLGNVVPKVLVVVRLTIRKLPQPIGKQHLEVSWVRNEKFHESSQLVDGGYLLRTNLTGVDPAMLWRRYIQLTEAEWAFRIARDELAIRPVWHQKEDHVRSHVLISFLADAMWKTLAGWTKGAGLGDEPRTLLYEFAKIKSGGGRR